MELALATHVQRLATGGNDSEGCGGREERRNIRCRREHLLAVIKEEQ
jgi:hypothetical protein